MPGSSNSSFIPKRNHAQHERSAVRRQVYVGTFIVRILFFASLIAAAGVYAYESKLTNDLNSEIAALNSAIGSFNEAELQRVISTDVRLMQVAYRVDHAVAITAILRALEEATIETSQITSLNIKRLDDSNLEVVTEMRTNTFDSALFQKEIFAVDKILSANDIKDLTLERQIEEGEGGTNNAESVTISFQALIGVAAESVPHTLPALEDIRSEEEVSQSEIISATSTSEEIEVGDEAISEVESNDTI